MSNKHLRIHTVLYDRDDGTGCEALVFAEDLSRNGTFLNGLLMGRGAGGFLLSNGDTMRISSRFHFRFVSCPGYEQNVDIPSDQEEEIRVRSGHSGRVLGSGLMFCSTFKINFLLPDVNLVREHSAAFSWPQTLLQTMFNMLVRSSISLDSSRKSVPGSGNGRSRGSLPARMRSMMMLKYKRSEV